MLGLRPHVGGERQSREPRPGFKHDSGLETEAESTVFQFAANPLNCSLYFGYSEVALRPNEYPLGLAAFVFFLEARNTCAAIHTETSAS